MLRSSFVAAVWCAWLVGTATTAWADSPRRPNIVLIVSDDQRPDTIHALGSPYIRTWGLDRLASRGTSFTRAACAYPICVASRAEMLTGCTAFRALQPYPNGKLNDALPTLPSVLQQAGYRTEYVGKWHTTGRPTTRGYERSRGLFASGSGDAPLTVPLDRFGQPHTGYRGWVFQDDDGTKHLERGVELTPNISKTIADAAIAAICVEDDPRPFFVHVNFTAPHDPRLLPPGFERVLRRPPPLPANFAAKHPFDHGNAGGRDEVLLPRPLEASTVRDELAIYYAIIEQLSDQVHRIDRALAERRIDDRTIVIFTSDHGLALGSHGLTGKQNMYEHTMNVPLIMAGPGIPQKFQLPAQCYLRDLYPTICEWAGLKAPAGIDGRSLRPLLNGTETDLHREIVGYFTDTQRMIRDDRWKLIRYPQINREQLFDLRYDPYELHDEIEENPTEAKSLRTKLDAWLKEHGDPLTK